MQYTSNPRSESASETESERLAEGSGRERQAESTERERPGEASGTERSGETSRRPTTVTVRVARSMNDHGAMTVEEPETNACYQIVEYASPRLRRYLDRFSRGEVLSLELERIETRGNCWRAVGVTSSRVEA